jgi:hypothetical protein
MNNTEWIFPLVSFVVGTLVGFFGGRFLERQEGDSNKSNTFVLVLVAFIWATSVLVDIISPEYETSPLIHGLMGAIVGFFFKPWQGITSSFTSRDNAEVERRRAYDQEGRERDAQYDRRKAKRK